MDFGEACCALGHSSGPSCARAAAFIDGAEFRSLKGHKTTEAWPAGDIWVGTLGPGTVTAKRLMKTPERDMAPDFSPEGRWLAYATNASGRSEVQVQPCPGPGPRRQVYLA